MANEVLGVSAVTADSRTLEDGRVELLVRVNPEEASGAVIRSLMVSGCNMGIVPLDYKKALYGTQAKQLRLSGFFRAPDVWAHIGSDGDYQKWCRKQPSAYSKRYGNEFNPMEFAHVRRASESGTAFKADYAGIPLLKSEHHLQHQHGESRLKSPEWFDQQRVKHVSGWAWLTLKQALGYESWNQVPPGVLFQWASERGLVRYLPNCYIQGGGSAGD